MKVDKQFGWIIHALTTFVMAVVLTAGLLYGLEFHIIPTAIAVILIILLPCGYDFWKECKTGRI
jgi:hypothetical protein